MLRLRIALTNSHQFLYVENPAQSLLRAEFMIVGNLPARKTASFSTLAVSS